MAQITITDAQTITRVHAPVVISTAPIQSTKIIIAGIDMAKYLQLKTFVENNYVNGAVSVNPNRPDAWSGLV